MKNIIKVLTVVVLIGGMFSFNTMIAPEKDAQVDQAFKWEKLGSRKVNMGGDRDVIPVTIGKGFYTKIKFKVLDAPILLRNVRVVFGNGEFKNVKFNRKFIAGSETRVIDLPGNKRVIKKIIINYTSVAVQKGEATVVVFGRH